MTTEKKKTSWIGGLMVVGLGIGASIGAMLDQMPVGAASGIGLGILAGAFADRMRQSKKE